MRRLAPALWLLAAACTVELEGAPCATDANCPDEQRCDAATQACVTCASDPSCTGDGFACAGTSVRECRTTAGGCRYFEVTPCQSPLACHGTFPSASCQCPEQAIGVGKGCATAGSRTCDPVSRNVMVCVQQGACRVWQADGGTTCTSQQLVCREPTPGATVCGCDDNPGSEFLADAVEGSLAGAAPYPTGVSTPPQCRFKRAGDALAAAASHAGDPPVRTATARAVGRSGDVMVFSGEQLPLEVRPGVTLTTDDVPLAAAGYVVDLDNAAQVTAAVQVEEDAALSGFLVRPSVAGGAGVGVKVACAAAGTDRARLSSVAVDGKGGLGSAVVGRGIELTGPCSVDLADVRVDSVTGAGVYLASTGMADGFPVLSLLRTTVAGAGDTGIQVRLDATPTLRPSLSIVRSELTGNTGAQYGAGLRRAGGVLFWGTPPSSLTFHSNRVHGNTGDQVVVYSGSSWDLKGGTTLAACGTTGNVFACYDTGAVGLGLASAGTVDARFNSWAHEPPTAGVDYVVAAGGSVNAVGAGSDVCPPVPVPPASCPLPPP